MTISTTTLKASYSGNGSTTAFAYTWKVFASTELAVYIRVDATGAETLKVEGTGSANYAVSGVGETSGGNVTFVTAPASGETIVILRSTAKIQGTDYQPADPFPAADHEDALDKLTHIAQELQEELDRSIKLSRTNTITSAEFTDNAATRSSQVLSFDSAGELSVTQEIGEFQGNWAASTAYVLRDLVKDTSNNNIYICITAHTSTGAQPISSNTDVAKWSLIVDAAAATTSATAAATSATAAAASATAAAASETAAETAETNAETAETNAETAETNAETAETNAGTSATNAATSATAAATSATASATSATAAATSATAAATSRTAAETAETNAETAETNAETAETNAETAETNAAASASAAATQASNAATSATAAAASATTATAQATTATSQATAAAASATAAAASADAFDDTYLGAKSSAPSVDNDGDALTAGDLYFNTSTNVMNVYTGSAWIAAAVSSAAVVEKTGATGSGQIPSGTTAQRDGSPAVGYFRYNSTTNEFEGYAGSSPAWGSIGGGAASYFIGSGAATGDTTDGLADIFRCNATAVATTSVVPDNVNCSSTGPITVNSGVTLTVGSGSTMVII